MVSELNSEFELKPCIVRIRRTTGEVVGAGFLVGEKHILTCTHVVAEALGIGHDQADPPEESVQLDFPLLAPGKHLRAQVVVWQPPRPDGRGDIAGLELDTPLPPESSPAHLVAAENLWGHSFRASSASREAMKVVPGPQEPCWTDRQRAGCKSRM
jgi:hypothetical protein